jgi:hypothetical protein
VSFLPLCCRLYCKSANLKFALLACPESRHHHCGRFLHNRFPQKQPYSKSQIHHDLTGSISQANLLRRHIYWNEAYPEGVVCQLTADMIDIGEVGFKLESGDRKFVRVFRPNVLGGNYTKGAMKQSSIFHTVVHGISRSPKVPERQNKELSCDPTSV